MKRRVLSRQQERELKKLLAHYHKYGDEIVHCKHLREVVANKIAQLICPFEVGEQVHPPKPTKISRQPQGLCQVIEVFAVVFPFEIDQHLTQPQYRFRVKRMLKDGSLGKRIYTAFWPDHWSKAI